MLDTDDPNDMSDLPSTTGVESVDKPYYNRNKYNTWYKEEENKYAYGEAGEYYGPINNDAGESNEYRGPDDDSVNKNNKDTMGRNIRDTTGINERYCKAI